MSRVGKKPIPIDSKTNITYKNRQITVKGPKGTLFLKVNSAVDLDIQESLIYVTLLKNERKSRALQGLTRSLIANMVTGVLNGFERTLKVNGIGYKAELKGKIILFNIGYSHPVNFPIPDGISVGIEKNTLIKLSGIDKDLLGKTAASIRQLRPPEPYKGKGIKYAEEYIQRKAGKTGAK